MRSLTVLLVSDDRSWLADAEEAVVLAGGVVVARCPDAVSALAQAALELVDVAVADSRTVDLDRDAVLRLRRRGMVVVRVSAERSVSDATAPSFDDVRDAIGWAGSRTAVLGSGPAKPRHALVAVFGVRGTPGASTVALALAKAATRPVALLDLDPRGGDLATILGLADGVSVTAATDAVAHGEAWAYTGHAGGAAFLAAPSRPWAGEVAPVDVGLLLDAVADARTTIVDGGLVGARLDDIAMQILARATSVVLVGRGDRVALPHVLRALDVLRPHASALTIVVNHGRGTDRPARVANEVRARGGAVVEIPDATRVEPLVDAVFSGPEEQHEPGGGVEQHQDRHRHARGRLRLRLRAGRDG